MAHFLIYSILLIFLFLSIIHVYWSFGGLWGFSEALPTNLEGKRMLHPKKIDSAVIGGVLVFIFIFYLIRSNLISIKIPFVIQNYLGWFVAFVFFIRAVGDFKYVGFFKRVKKTKFANLDTKYFSPLCLIISIFLILIELL